MKINMIKIARGERNLTEKAHKFLILNEGFPTSTSLEAFLTPQIHPIKMQISKAPTAREIFPKSKSIQLRKLIFVKKEIAPVDKADGMPNKKAINPVSNAARLLDQFFSSTR